MKIGFTGTRNGMTLGQKLKLFELFTSAGTFQIDEFHHGDCVGADEEAHNVAKEFGIVIHSHPCNLESKYWEDKVGHQIENKGW